MSNIISMEEQRNQVIMSEINAILEKYGKVMSPSITMKMGGISFAIDIVDKPRPAQGGTGSGIGGDSHG